MGSRVEQRKAFRYKASEGATIVTPYSVCQLVDLSSGGIAIRGHRNLDIPEEFLLDIIIAGQYNYYENKVPVKLIWEKRVPHSHLPLFTLKNLGLQFSNTTSPQQFRIDKYLEKHAQMME